jgi:hypothetical protein
VYQSLEHGLVPSHNWGVEFVIHRSAESFVSVPYVIQMVEYILLGITRGNDLAFDTAEAEIAIH